MAKTIVTYYYEFEDGYFLYSVGRMTKTEQAWEVVKHGKLVAMRVV